MLDGYKPGMHNTALHLQVLAWPRSAISLKAAGQGQVESISQAMRMVSIQALTLRVILWDCHKKEVAHGRKQN